MTRYYENVVHVDMSGQPHQIIERTKNVEHVAQHAQVTYSLKVLMTLKHFAKNTQTLVSCSQSLKELT